MDDLTIHFDGTGPRAVLAIEGPLDAQHCRLLRDALDMARTVRPDSPVDIDLADVTRLGVAARVCLAAALGESRRSDRSLRLRNVPPQAGAVRRLPRPRHRAAVHP